jgi:signal transduction histidine kinase
MPVYRGFGHFSIDFLGRLGKTIRVLTAIRHGSFATNSQHIPENKKAMDLPNNVSSNPVLMNELLLDSLPHPAMVIGRDRVVLSANRCAREAGARVGGYCWKDFGQGKYIPEADRKFLAENPTAIPRGGTRCTFCLADTALDENRPENNPELKAFGRVWDTWWVPIGKDLYLHYAIDMTAQREAEAVLERSREDLEKLVAERTQDLQRSEKRYRTLADKLEQSNHALEDFAFIASHDLQEPLRKIQAFSERLKTRCAEKLDPQEMDYLERLCNAASRMKALVGALLNLSRINTRGQPFMTVNLGELVREVIAGFEEPVHEYVVIGELPAIQADPSQMMQLFQNLIGNALKFRKKEKPSIRISSRPLPASKNREPMNQPQWHDIRVEDDGIGFDMEHASRIFAPFQRLHGRSEYPGQGMGLAICKRVVERHGGTIKAQGTPGEGARFMIRLPSSPCAAETAEIDPD